MAQINGILIFALNHNMNDFIFHNIFPFIMYIEHYRTIQIWQWRNKEKRVIIHIKQTRTLTKVLSRFLQMSFQEWDVADSTYQETLWFQRTEDNQPPIILENLKLKIPENRDINYFNFLDRERLSCFKNKGHKCTYTKERISCDQEVAIKMNQDRHISIWYKIMLALIIINIEALQTDTKTKIIKMAL
jgi:hypothetical protein